MEDFCMIWGQLTDTRLKNQSLGTKNLDLVSKSQSLLQTLG